MQIQNLSIRSATVTIFLMIGSVAIVLSLFAGSYFRQAALDSQVNSLSRVLEVASQEMLKEVRQHTFDLGMRLGHSEDMIEAIRLAEEPDGVTRLQDLLDDPFINGFVGFPNINLEKIRVYDMELTLLAESRQGTGELDQSLPAHLVDIISRRSGVDRLKAVDALWLSPAGPLHSSVVPIGGLRLIGYMEIVINPVFNLPNIGNITRTPISIFSIDGRPIIEGMNNDLTGQLPVEYTMFTSDGQPAFRIIGHENVQQLDQQMAQTQMITTGGFLLLTIGTLLFALWMFNRFLFVPVRRMVIEMKRMADGDLELSINKNGLKEISSLAESFESMADQVRMRTNDLERLLDLDDSAILCFGSDGEAIYFNHGACSLFGYSSDEVSDLDLNDIFSSDVDSLMRETGRQQTSTGNKLHLHLNCVDRHGMEFKSDAVIRSLQGMGGQEGYAIVLQSISKDEDNLLAENVEQRMNAVEQSLNNLLEIARNNQGLIPASTGPGTSDEPAAGQEMDKNMLREQAVNVMSLSLACWEHELGRNKLDLAEESGIWPVYIDKSTPTTRTLDKYLNIESCPKNPRTQRVIDTAEFVLKQCERKNTNEQKHLRQALGDFRNLISGLKHAGS